MTKRLYTTFCFAICVAFAATVSFAGGLEVDTINTGQGANEVYAMDQNVRTTDDVTLNSLATTGDITVGSAGKVGIGTATPSALLEVRNSGGDASTDLATGGTPNASSELPSGPYVASYAFDDNTGGLPWYSNGGFDGSGNATGGGEWLRYQLASAAVVRKYRIYGSASTAANAASWTFEGSNNGADWTVLHTVSDSLITASAWNTFDSSDFTNNSAYTYYRLLVTKTGGNVNLAINEVELIEGLYDNKPLTATASGNVGIGTESPSEALEVEGVVKVNDTTNAPSTTTDRLYNNGGNLYWNGTQLDAASGGLATSAAQYVIVELADGNSDTENVTALQAALTAARALSPSAANRVAVIVPPGRYNLGTGAVALDTPYMDLVGLTTNREAQYIYGTANGANTGVVMQTADNVRIENLKVECTRNSGLIVSIDESDPCAYRPHVSWDAGASIGSSANTVIRNCAFLADDLHAWSMRIGSVHYAGTYENCTGKQYSFGADGTASGTFIRCTGGSQSFGGSGTASGTFTECTGGTRSFGGQGGTASGTFDDCTGDDQSFGGGGGTASGSFNNCTGGDQSFGGGDGTASGVFRYCVTAFFGFGGGSGGTGSAAGGNFYFCEGESDAFTTNGPPTVINCIRGGSAYP